MATTAFPFQQPATGSMELILDLIWQHALNNLNRTNNEILLPFDIHTLIGAASLETIKSRFSNLLNCPVVGFQDVANNVYRIMSTAALDGSLNTNLTHILPLKTDHGQKYISNEGGPSNSANRATKAEKIRRPPNAFILYRTHHQPLIKAAHPEYHNNDISKILGKKWKAESQETRAHFEAAAAEVKRKHFEQHPNYQYAPRKPSEKKRRSTARRPIFRSVTTDGDSGSLQLSIRKGDAATTSTGVTEQQPTSPESNSAHTENSDADSIAQPSTSQEFEQMLRNHTSNFVLGQEDGGFMAYGSFNSPVVSISAPSIPPAYSAGPSGGTQSAGDENSFHWNHLDVDFDEYFVGAAG